MDNQSSPGYGRRSLTQMLQNHPEIVTPDDGTILWRYINLEKFIALLCDQSLFMCRLDKFRDPWEGVWPPSIINAIRAKHAPSAEPVANLSEYMRQIMFVNCWHASEHESAALWDLYSGSAGLAIRTTAGMLKSAIIEERPFYFGEVSYRNYDAIEVATGSLLNAFVPPFLKRKSFQHEQEVRILIEDFPFDTSGAARAPLESTKINVELPKLIDAIYVSPSSSRWLPSYITELIRRFKLPKIPVHSSNLYDECVY